MSNPEANERVGTWLVPIDGVFLDTHDKFMGDPFGPPHPFAIEIEPGVFWRTATEADETLITRWHQDFRRFHAESDSETMARVDCLLTPDQISPFEEHGDVPSKLDAILIALTLHTNVPLAAQFLRFRIEEPGATLIPDSGNRSVQTVRLRGWDEAAALTRESLSAVAATFTDVRRVRALPLEHALARSLGAFRAATSSHVYVDAIPVLACASLEALTGTYKSGRVIARVLPRYELSEDAVPRLETFYKLRQWFAHGADVPEMREAEVRSETLDDGLRLVKGILRSALADPQLLAAANEGTATVKQYLDNREY